MLLLYNLGLHIYSFLILTFSLFNKKAKLWINGRRNVELLRLNSSVWFHFASLGEFEQGRPVLERYRTEHPKAKIVITFFSPSGYEIRKSTSLADVVYYLPLDTAANARYFIDAINPTLAVFTKYEYWYHYFNELNKRQIPLYIISGIFRKNQVFFRWYGGLHRQILGFVSHFFLQDEQSQQLLQAIDIRNTSVSGDTRFDRVWANTQSPKSLPEIEAFADNQKVLIAGSTWPADEQLIATLVRQYPNWKFIIAPHEVEEDKINRLINLLPENSWARFSQITNVKFQVLIIDNIGILSSLYKYGDIAYIGGGFGAGIHNTLEAAAFGLPVVFGPKYQKFKEAKDLIALGAGFCIMSEASLKKVITDLVAYPDLLDKAGQTARQYVKDNIGATDTILNKI
jgi:3-deoxy-D-manno-octulosonic-acid transferase